MSMRAMDELREMLCKELDEIGQKHELSAGDLETVHKLTDTIKNIDKIEMYEGGGYSQSGDWEAQMRGNYGHGNSYTNRGEHYVRGHYSRNDGYSQRGRDYSRDTGNRMQELLEEMMDEAQTEKEKNAVRDFKKRLG